LLQWQEFATQSVAVWQCFFDVPWRCQWRILVGRYPETGGRRGFKIIPAVLECSNCSLHATVEAALSQTIATVSLSTAQRLDCPAVPAGVSHTATTKTWERVAFQHFWIWYAQLRPTYHGYCFQVWHVVHQKR